jgi:hypothetical protein
MKIKHGRTEPQLLKNSEGKYELIGSAEEDVEAAKQWASFCGHEIVPGKFTRTSFLKHIPHLSFIKSRIISLNMERFNRGSHAIAAI